MILHPGADLLQQVLQAFATAVVDSDRVIGPSSCGLTSAWHGATDQSSVRLRALLGLSRRTLNEPDDSLSPSTTNSLAILQSPSCGGMQPRLGFRGVIAEYDEAGCDLAYRHPCRPRRDQCSWNRA